MFQPSRPVANFFLALGQFLGGGELIAQRLLSLLFHGAVTVLLYLNLRLQLRRTDVILPTGFAFIVCGLFALAPIHSETLAIAQFRAEILASFFALSGFFVSQLLSLSGQSKLKRLFLYGLFFLLAGLTQLSKETYLPVFLIGGLVFHYGVTDFTKRLKAKPAFFVALGLITTFWAAIFLLLLRSPSLPGMDYGQYIGWHVVSWYDHLTLSARALLEGVWKSLSGIGLTTVRLSTRQGMGAHLGIVPAAGILLVWVGLAAWLWRRQNWTGIWAVILFVASTIYLAIPNINLGSEHYWYFSTTALMVLAALGFLEFQKKIVRSFQVGFFILAVGYGLGLVSLLQVRLFELRSRVDFSMAELRHHPETPGTWQRVADALLDAQFPPGVAKRYIDQANTFLPKVPRALKASFVYFIRLENEVEAEKALRTIERVQRTHPDDLARYHSYLGSLYKRKGNCDGLVSHLLRSWRIASPPKRKSYERRLEVLLARKTRCGTDCPNPRWCL